jgi:hypothetical protein
MSKMTRFRYSGFNDVPRGIVLKYRGKFFFLDSSFDDNADEYPDRYIVYVFPESMEAAAANSSWDFLGKLASLDHVGTINVKEVYFDRSRRKKLDATVLEQSF